MIKLIRRTVKDPAVADQLIPDYPVFCKRTPIVDDYCTAHLTRAPAGLLYSLGLLEFVILAHDDVVRFRRADLQRAKRHAGA